MDDGFELEFRDRTSRARSKRGVLWSPGYLVKVRNYILKENDQDFVLESEIANKLNIQPHIIGACLKILVRDNILLSRRPIAPLDRNGDEVHVWLNNRLFKWNGRIWVTEESARQRSRRTGRIRGLAKKVGEIPLSPKVWDGYGYYILRGDEFRAECRKAGLTEDPVNDPWTCTNVRCRTYNWGPTWRTHCGKCHEARAIRQEPSKPEPRITICPRCSSVLSFKNVCGKKKPDHSLRKCNLALVKNLLEE